MSGGCSYRFAFGFRPFLTPLRERRMEFATPYRYDIHFEKVLRAMFFQLSRDNT